MTSISDRCKTARDAATPGPWRLGEPYPDGPVPLIDDGDLIGTVSVFSEATERLIALAPEMADEVIRLTDAFEELAAALAGHRYDFPEIAYEIRNILNQEHTHD